MIIELTFYIYKYIFANYNDCFHTLKNKPKSNCFSCLIFSLSQKTCFEYLKTTANHVYFLKI